MSKTILFQGDSITDGNRYKLKEQERDLNHQIGHGYQFIINGKLGVEFADKNLKFVNKGVSGNRIVDMFARMQEDVININPDIVSFLIGINDVGSQIDNNSGTDPVKFERVYHLILDEIKEKLPMTKVVLCEPFLLPVGRVKENLKTWEETLFPLQKIVKKVAEAYGAIYVPLQGVFNELCEAKEPSYWIWDGVHPTVCGHQVIADEWMKATKKLFVQI